MSSYQAETAGHGLASSGAQHQTTYRDDQQMLKAAEDIALKDKAMGFREAVYVYRKSVFWSMLLSTALIMEGYDVVIVSEIRPAQALIPPRSTASSGSLPFCIASGR